MSTIQPLHRQATLPERPTEKPGYLRRVFGREHRQKLGKASKFEPVSLKLGTLDQCRKQVEAKYRRPTASSADSQEIRQLRLAVEDVKVDFTTDAVSTQAAFGSSYEFSRAKWTAARDLVKSHEDAKGLQARRTSSSSLSSYSRRNSQTYRPAAGQRVSQKANDLNQQIINDRNRVQKLIQDVKDTYPSPTTSSADGYVVKQLAAAVNQVSPDLRKSNGYLWLSASELVKAHQDARRATPNGPGRARWQELQNPFVENPFE